MSSCRRTISRAAGSSTVTAAERPARQLLADCGSGSAACAQPSLQGCWPAAVHGASLDANLDCLSFRSAAASGGSEFKASILRNALPRARREIPRRKCSRSLRAKVFSNAAEVLAPRQHRDSFQAHPCRPAPTRFIGLALEESRSALRNSYFARRGAWPKAWSPACALL